MPALFSQKPETLSNHEIINAYTAAYHSVHEGDPDCEVLESGMFLIEGVKRNRQWVLLEVERLRQMAFSQTFSSHNLDKPADSAYQTIRRLSKF